MHDLLARSALEQARLIQGGAASVEEVTKAYLSRLEVDNARVGAFVTISERSALRQARALDKLRRTERQSAPLFGVPIGIKDLNPVRGMRMTAGTRSLKYFYAPIDDAVAGRVRASGLVILGKLATSELGILPFVETLAHPPALNPHDVAYTAGGSSGGSGAAVGAKLLPLAHGSDAGGSIRIPASFCGVIGFKPSRGALVEPHRWIDFARITTEGPLARTVDDAAAFLDVLSIVGARFLDEARARPPRLTVRFAVDSPNIRFSPAAIEAIVRTAKALEALGHRVEQGALASGSVDEFLPLMQRMTSGVPMPFSRLLHPVTRWMREEGRRYSREQVLDQAKLLSARVQQWFGDADLWLIPTVANPPPRVGALDGLEPHELFHRAADLGRLTAAFNVAGMPAVSLPVGRTDGGLPVGVQLAMRQGRDGTLLAVARELEQSGLFTGL